MSVAILVALVSGLIALMSVGISAYATFRTMQLQNNLATRREQASRKSALHDATERYRSPLLRAAIDLDGRLYSIVQLDFMKRHLTSKEPSEREYATTSTIFRLAEYFGWVEVLRRGVQFLDLGDEVRSQELTRLLHEVSLCFANSHEFPDAALRIFRDEQRAIGELMLDPVHGDPRGYQCIGYAAFSTKLSADPSFVRWFARLGEQIRVMADSPPEFLDRLVQLHESLTLLLDFLNPGGVRYPSAEQEVGRSREPGEDRSEHGPV
jgi:hypothetical protein